MGRTVRLAVLGAGLIGRRHAEHIRAVADAELCAIVDPAPAGVEFAARTGVRHFPDLSALLAADRPDGIVVATPNTMHVANGLEAVAAGVPVLVEKPIADDVESGARLVAAAEAANVPLLVGHHRRHNPVIRAAKATVESGKLGRIVAVHGFFWLMKPDEYFDVAWRRAAGAGPMLINFIHDVDLLRHLCGEVEQVHALSSNAIRGNEVEETCVVLLRFANGALGTVSVSDTVVGPWSWEQTAGENPAYPQTDQACYHIGGTHGSLSIPRLETWSNDGKRGWWEPLRADRAFVPPEDPLRLQIGHFCRVIRDGEAPLVSGREGLETLKVVATVREAIRTGGAARVSSR